MASLSVHQPHQLPRLCIYKITHCSTQFQVSTQHHRIHGNARRGGRGEHARHGVPPPGHHGVRAQRMAGVHDVVVHAGLRGRQPVGGPEMAMLRGYQRLPSTRETTFPDNGSGDYGARPSSCPPRAARMLWGMLTRAVPRGWGGDEEAVVVAAGPRQAVAGAGLVLKYVRARDYGITCEL